MRLLRNISGLFLSWQSFVILVVVLLALCGGVWPYGGALFCCFAGISFILRLREQDRVEIAFPGVVFFTFACIAVVQSFLSPYFFAGIPHVLFFLAYFFCFHIFSTGKFIDNVEKCLTYLLIVLCVVVLLGIVSLFTKHGDLLFVTKQFYKNRLTGTLLNPNHFACLINLCLPFCFFKIIHSKKRALCVFWIAVHVFLSTAIFMTLSLSGLLGYFLSLIFCAVFLKSRYVRFFAFLVGVIALVLCVYSFNQKTVFDAFMANKCFSLAAHYDLFAANMATFKNMLIANPFVFFWGKGSGMYPFVFAEFYPSLTFSYILHAHNDFAEIFIENGLVGLVVYFTFFVVISVKAMVEAEKGKRSYAVCVLSVVGSFFVQSLFGFNFILPVVFVVFLFFISGLYAQQEDKIILLKSKIIKSVLYVAACVCIGLSILLFAEGGFVHVAQNMVKTGNLSGAEKMLSYARFIVPGKADAYRESGEFYLFSGGMSHSENKLELAEKYFLRAYELNSMDAVTCARLGVLYQYLKRNEKAEEWFDLSVKLLPYSLAARVMRLDFYLANSSMYTDKILKECAYIEGEIDNFTFAYEGQRVSFMDRLEVYKKKAMGFS